MWFTVTEFRVLPFMLDRFSFAAACFLGYGKKASCMGTPQRSRVSRYEALKAVVLGVDIAFSSGRASPGRT